MTQEESIRYLCRIKALVWRSIDPHGLTASDCVCADQTLPKDLIRDEGHALDWMLEAVVKRLEDCRYIIDTGALAEVTDNKGRVTR